MRLVRFQRYRHISLGALQSDGRIVDLPAAAAALLCIELQDPCWESEVALRLPADVGRFLAAGPPSRELADAACAFTMRHDSQGIAGEPLLIEPREVRLLPPLVPPLILSDGARLLDADGAERKYHREFFMHNPLNLRGASDDLELPHWLSDEFHVAARIAIVIGRPLRCASLEEAEEAIFGYCPAVEICALDLQRISWAGPMFHVQYPHARAFDGSLLIGPSVVGKEDAGDILGSTARLVIDGTSIVEAPLALGWGEILEWICRLSDAVVLEPGTLLLPGAATDAFIQATPTTDPPLRIVAAAPIAHGLLRHGAAVTAEIAGVGRIDSRISRT
jgi:2-keto-4-pentenoate hydratase/2-oxohepta-3-ene-1,7-dioic acid hydratase in catechol pathway